MSKSSSPSEDPDSRILRGYYGAKGSRDSGPFDIKPKAYVEEEEVPKDKWKESRPPDCTAEDDPALGRPKSQERKRHVARGNPFEDRKRDSKPYGLAIGAWWRSNPRRSRHFRIKYPQLTPWPHWCGCNPWTGRWGPQQPTERQKKWPMGRTLEDRHG